MTDAMHATPRRVPRGTTPHHLNASRSDELLLVDVRNGDASAYAELYRRYEPETRRFARSLARHDDVDDIVAESFAKMLRALLRHRGPVDHPARYLMVTVRSTAATVHLRRARSQQVQHHIGVPGAEEDPTPILSDDRLVTAFRSLTPRWRTVIWWSEIDGLNPSEIGERLGLSAGAASALTYRARRALREAFGSKDEGEDVPQRHLA